MKAAFCLLWSDGAAFRSKHERTVLATEAVTKAEMITPKAAFFILNDDRGMKIVVKLKERKLWIMTTREGVERGLPTAPDGEGPAPSAN